MNEISGGIQAAIDAGKNQVPPSIAIVEGRTVGIFHSKDLAFLPIKDDHLYPHPNRPTGVQKVYDEGSFIEYVKSRAHVPDTVLICASFGAKKFTAAFNSDRRVGNSSTVGFATGSNMVAGWGDWGAEFPCAESSDLKKYRSVFDLVDQQTFAEFLEEHAHEIDGGIDLLEAAKTFDTTRSVSCRSTIRMQDGSVKFAFSDEAQSEAVLPPQIVITIPLFQGGPLYRLGAFLRYRVRDGGVKFLLRPKLLDTALDQSFSAMAARISDALKDYGLFIHVP